MHTATVSAVSNGIATVDREADLQPVRNIVAQEYWIGPQHPGLSYPVQQVTYPLCEHTRRLDRSNGSILEAS